MNSWLCIPVTYPYKQICVEQVQPQDIPSLVYWRLQSGAAFEILFARLTMNRVGYVDKIGLFVVDAEYNYSYPLAIKHDNWKSRI